MDQSPEIQSNAAVADSPKSRGSLRRLRLPWRRRPETPAEPEALTVVAHLVELRNRVFISLFSLVPGSVLGYVFANRIIEVLKRPLPTHDPLVYFGLAGAFVIQLKIALVAGAITGMPVILYQFWRFISPGLTPNERKAARPWVPLALVFFATGVAAAYFILPYATGFLYSFQSSDLKLVLSADEYFGFVTTLFLAFGLVMEYPIVLVLLARVGIVSSKRLRSSRRMALMTIVIVSALITPGADLVSPIVMAFVMYGLYEVSIILIRMQGR